MQISTILFDLGSTLLYFRDPWPPIFVEADRALVAVLQRAGLPLEDKFFRTESGGFLETYYTKRVDGIIEKTTMTALKEYLASKGFRAVTDSTLRAALDAMYSITQQNWYLEEDTIPTLEILRERGFKLGLISNTSDDKNAQDLIDYYRLRSYFELVVTSAGCGIRKPDGRIFQMALDHFHVQPKAMMMVGDTLDADILGANQKGIYSVWINRRVAYEEEGELTIQPQAVISSLTQIPILLTELTEMEDG
jgi:HAD superfamily hydrolase (TIGR01662 family)